MTIPETCFVQGDVSLSPPPKPRVLAVSHDFSNSGAPIALFNALSGLSIHYDITVASPSIGPMLKTWLDAGILAIVVGSGPSPKPNVQTDVNVVGNLLVSHDIVLANTILAYRAVNAAAAMKKPSLWWIHEGRTGTEGFMPKHPAIVTAMCLADCVAYPAKFSRDLYAAHRAGHRTEIIRYGVPDQPVDDTPRSPGPVRVLQLGTFEPRKGQDVLLKAFAMLKDEDVELSIVGRVAATDYHAAVMAEYGNLPRLRVFGEVSRENASEAIRQCDILVVPSRDEVTPLVILEAMAMGKPVIASRVCGIPEMFADAHAGYFFNADDHEELAKKIKSMAYHVEFRTGIGKNGPQCCPSLHSSQQQLRTVLDSLLKR